jgi:hypothetical protein
VCGLFRNLQFEIYHQHPKTSSLITYMCVRKYLKLKTNIVDYPHYLHTAEIAEEKKTMKEEGKNKYGSSRRQEFWRRRR